ncbi:DUF5687 family protein [Zeaxanthinibacter enoshimensis]|uniref:DUF5687 family protein n=1 Tax=Zeaxanthinibacter enoshimensis TaxID=392009 RepID=UPI0035647DBC
MFRHFISLQRKSFFRSSSFGKSLAIKILMGFFALYMLVSFLGLGVALYFILEKQFPGSDPLIILSEYLVYWVLAELFMRYMLQKLPYMDVKPLLIQPIPKSRIIHFLLGKTAFSFYNFMSLVFFVPFAVVLVNKDYPAIQVAGFVMAMAFIAQAINYTNFLVNKNEKVLIGLAVSLTLFSGLEYFEIWSVTAYSGQVFYSFYSYPLAFLLPLVLVVVLYTINYRQLKQLLFLDVAVKKKTQAVSGSDLGWTRRLGNVSPFIRLDLRLIWRNKRTKTQVFISLAMVLYGLIFYTMDDFGSTSAMLVFVGIFITGIFMVNFGQFIPAWDSEYYGMMMAQNIPLRLYLESKSVLISVSIVVMFLLSIPYLYFGWEALAINTACALYNLGINIPVILYFGSFNKKRIDLTKSPVGNMQGTSATQFLIILPLMVLPILLYLGIKFLFSFELALLILSLLGVGGFAARNHLMEFITSAYRKRKYSMVAGFGERNS